MRNQRPKGNELWMIRTGPAAVPAVFGGDGDAGVELKLSNCCDETNAKIRSSSSTEGRFNSPPKPDHLKSRVP